MNISQSLKNYSLLATLSVYLIFLYLSYSLKMKAYLKLISIFTILLFSSKSFSSSLAEDAQDRGINQTCNEYLSQIEKSYGINGLNITGIQLFIVQILFFQSKKYFFQDILSIVIFCI